MQVPTVSLTPGVLQPSPLKELRPEIQNGRPFYGRETCYLVSNIRYSIQLQSFHIGEQFCQRLFLILTLHGKICQKNFLHWLPWSLVTLRVIQDSEHCLPSVWRSFGPWVNHSQVSDSLMHKIGHMNLTLDRNILKYTRWNDSMFPPFEKQSSTKLAWAQPSKRGEIMDDKHSLRP
jgi:hypothetical protein